MNYLLVVPRVVDKIGDFYLFPVGIAYISSAMKKAGFRPHKLNLNHSDLSVYDALKSQILSLDINVLLIGGLTGQYGAIRLVIESARMIKSNIIIIVGGGIVTSAPIYAMQALRFADYGIIGEGDIITVKLCRALENGKGIENIPGLAYEDGQGYKLTDINPEAVDVNSIPFPDYEGFGIEKLLETVPNIIGMGDYNTFPIITSRGCPYRCTFCFHPSGQKYRKRHLDDVFTEIDSLISKYGIKFLAVLDELFSHDFERVKDFCSRIKKRGIKWWAEFRVSDVTPELVNMLKASGCTTMAFGIESADNRILKSMNKKITIEQTNKALKTVYDAGIGIAGCLIFGDISETVETATNTFNWWKKNIHYGLQLSLVVTYPGTELFKYACNNDLIKNPIQFIKDGCPVVRLSKKMTRDEYAWMVSQILALQRMASISSNEITSLSIDYEQANMDITGICNSCKHQNSWSKIRFFITESLTCKNCGRRHYSPVLPEITDKISENLNKLLKKHDKICFFGVNSYFFAFCKKLQVPRASKIFFVDKSEVRHGISMYGDSKIQAPEIIEKYDIKILIVAVPQYYSNLLPVLTNDFPKIERIVNITHLLSDNFDC